MRVRGVVCTYHNEHFNSRFTPVEFSDLKLLCTGERTCVCVCLCVYVREREREKREWVIFPLLFFRNTHLFLLHSACLKVDINRRSNIWQLIRPNAILLLY